MVNNQYPHYLYVMTSGEPTMSSNGDWISSGGVWTLVGSCREETNGKGSEVVTSDFKSYKFSSLIQCPKGTTTIAEGTEVMVTEEPYVSGVNVRIKGVCAKFDSGRLHCRLWV